MSNVAPHLLDDGSWLLFAIDEEPAKTQVETPAGVLGFVDRALEAIAGGVAANVTFETLRYLASRASDALGLASGLGPDDIANTVTLFLLANGYSTVAMSEVIEVRDRGWQLAGNVDGLPFRARAEASGRVVHLIVDP